MSQEWIIVRRVETSNGKIRWLVVEGGVVVGRFMTEDQAYAWRDEYADSAY